MILKELRMPTSSRVFKVSIFQLRHSPFFTWFVLRCIFWGWLRPVSSRSANNLAEGYPPLCNCYNIVSKVQLCLSSFRTSYTTPMTLHNYDVFQVDVMVFMSNTWQQPCVTPIFALSINSLVQSCPLNYVYSLKSPAYQVSRTP